MPVALVLCLAACGGSTIARPDGGGDAPPGDGAPPADGGPLPDRQLHPDAATEADGAADDGSATCPPPVAAAAPVLLADFETGVIPSSDTLPEGFRGSDVARGTIVQPGANGTTSAVEFSFASDNSTFFQGSTRPQYLDGTATYHADLANALEFWIRIPAGSGLLSSTQQTFSIYTYHWKPGDPWVGTNPTGGNLTDSQMRYGPLRFDPAGADQWLHVVMSTSAFDHSRGNYHFYAARAVVEDLSFFGALRQFQTVFLGDRSSGPTTVRFDEFRLITIPPTATVCPAVAARTVAAAGGDVAILIEFANPTNTARTYRGFVSSTIGVDRQTLESAMHDVDDVGAIDDLQGAVGSDGSIGAVELFAADSGGSPTGPSVIATGGAGITVAPHASWRGVLVHHVTAGMLGAPVNATTGGRSYTVRRDTLVTSAIFWDPSEPRRADAAVVFMGSNADQSHPAPSGFPAFAAPPAGWRSTDVPPDQVGGYFVSVVTLTP